MNCADMLTFISNISTVNWICWGIAPIVVADVSLISYMFIFETAGRLREAQYATISYGKSKSRNDCIQNTHHKLSHYQQLVDVAFTLFGPTALVNALSSAVISSYFFPVGNSTQFHPPLNKFVGDLILLIILGDFALYWGHRVQHMSDILWKYCHSYHHQIDTPSAISTASIDAIDGTLQGGLPILFAAVLVSPHPVTYWVYVSLRLLDNVMNHSGIRLDFRTYSSIDLSGCTFWQAFAVRFATLLTLLTLKNFSPRAGVEHHDYHHKYSNYTANSKNFGEYFTVWDHVFGTLSKASAFSVKHQRSM